MKNTFKTPKTAKGWFSAFLIFVVLLVGSWPVIPLVNKNILVLGMPLLMVWSAMIIFLTVFVMIFIDKIGGAD